MTRDGNRTEKKRKKVRNKKKMFGIFQCINMNEEKDAMVFKHNFLFQARGAVYFCIIIWSFNVWK